MNKDQKTKKVVVFLVFFQTSEKAIVVAKLQILT